MNSISKKNSINHFFYRIIASVFLLAPITISGYSAEDHLGSMKYAFCTIDGNRYIVPSSRQDIIKNIKNRCDGLFFTADGRAGAFDAVSEVCARADMWRWSANRTDHLREWPQSYSTNPAFGIRISCRGQIVPENKKLEKKVYCNIGKSSFSYKPNLDYYVFRSYKLSENRRHFRRNYKIIGDYNNRSLQNAQKIQAGGKMEFIMKAPLRELCPHLKNNCNTAESFVSDLCGRLNENAVLPSSAYTGQ